MADLTAISIVRREQLAIAHWQDFADARRDIRSRTAREVDDGFGKSVGNELIGIYASGEVRGLSTPRRATTASKACISTGQARLRTIVRGSTVRVALSAFGYPLPAPTGIVDLELRRPGGRTVASVQLNGGDYTAPIWSSTPRSR